MESSIYSDGFCGVGRPCPNHQRLISVSDSEEEKPQLVIHHQAPSALCRESSSLCELHQHCPEALFQATIVKVNPATGKPIAWAQTYHRSLNSDFVAPHKNLQRRPKTMDFRMDDLLNQMEGSQAEEHIEFTPEDDPKMMPLKDDLIKAWEKLHEKEQEVEEMAMQWRTNTLEFLKGVMLKELEASRAEERCLVLYRRPGDVQKLDEEGNKLEVEEPKVEEQVMSRQPHASDFLIDVMMTQMEAWRMENSRRSKKEQMLMVEELSEESPKLEEEGEKLEVEEQKLEERTPQRQLNELHFQASRTKEYCAIVSRRPKNAMRMSMEEELTEDGQKLEEEGEKLEVKEEKAEEKVEEKMGTKPKKKQAEVVKVPKVISHKQSFDKATSMRTIGTQTNPYPIVQDKGTSMSSMCQLPEKISPEIVPLHSTPAPGGQRIKKEVNCMATQYGLSVGQLAKKVQILKVKELVAGEPIPKPEPPELSTSLPWNTTDSDQGENRVGDSLSSGEPLSPTPPSHYGSDYTRKPGEHLKKLYPSQVKQVSAKKKLNINIQDSKDIELRTEATLAAALAHSHKEFERLAREARKDPNKSIPKPKRHHSAGDSAK